MKKIILLALALVLLGTTACEKNNTGKNEPNNNENNNSSQVEQEKPEKWGVTETFATFNNGVLAPLYINFPAFTGIQEATGIIGHQADETCVVLDAYVDGISPQINSISEVLPAYFEQTKNIFKMYLEFDYKNAKFSVESKKLVTINDYEMCKYVGTHSYMHDKKEYSHKFVAYATQSKLTGAYIYWLVQDESKDNSMFDTIEEYAYKMATTLVEED